MAQYPIETARLRDRSPAEVFDDHLRNRRLWQTEYDIARNYAPDVVILSRDGVYHGHDGVRDSARVLSQLLPGARFEYQVMHVEGPYAYLEWTGRSQDREVLDGADTFMIQRGSIVAQSMHYTVRRAGG